MGIGNKETVYDMINKRPIPEGFNSKDPFELEVDKITDTEDTSVILHGYVKSGMLNLGDKLHIKGMDEIAVVHELRIHYGDKRIDVKSIRQADRVRITVRGIDKYKIQIGTVVYK